MRQFTSRGFVVILCLSLTALGCGRQAPPPKETTGSNPPSPADAASPGANVPSPSATPDLSLYLPAEPSKEDRYNAALHDAITRLTERKHAEALASLEVARSINDTQQVRQEIARIKLLIEQQAAAERTADDLQAVLRDGKAEDAARLSRRQSSMGRAGRQPVRFFR